ncbi:fatty acid hydroxylase [Rhodobacteraceae bacterium CCMM004]|nr:fatty acid hydroxylase [Rhodobacteraceae bacterium CCMM004]
MSDRAILRRVRLMSGHGSVRALATAALLGATWLAVAAPGWVWALVPLGVAAQMLNEYLLHRFVFHLPPPRRQWAFDLLYRAHYGHHDFPTAPHLFFVPVWVAVPVLAANLALVWAAVTWAWPGAPAREIAVAVGGGATFLAYEWFHMTAHLPVRRGRVERHVARLHGQHHFRDPGAWFHVTPGGAAIDLALGTVAGAGRRRFLRTLGLAPNDPRLVSARSRIAAARGVAPAEIARAARGTSAL